MTTRARSHSSQSMVNFSYFVCILGSDAEVRLVIWYTETSCYNLLYWPLLAVTTVESVRLDVSNLLYCQHSSCHVLSVHINDLSLVGKLQHTRQGQARSNDRSKPSEGERLYPHEVRQLVTNEKFSDLVRSLSA